MAPIPFRRPVVLATALLLLVCLHSANAYSMDDVEFGDDDDMLGLETTSMLQLSMELSPSADQTVSPPTGSRDMAGTSHKELSLSDSLHAGSKSLDGKHVMG
mmetsp:Transcript_20362/g.57285  ORF Transcript_20362/g.57285 Transcript_20362/m.57285 type:complete len:102 (-) Transcript_20362:67-372(-)